MSKPRRPRRALGAATLVAGAAVTPLALATVPVERVALEARVEAVRQALMKAAAAVGPNAESSWTVAQATNWTNWPKWSKWANWANK